MSAVQILTDLGFVNPQVVHERKGKVCVKVWTSRGWAYERFQDSKTLADEIAVWARSVEPGAW